MNVEINQKLKQLSDKKYAEFIKNLSLSKYEILGVRMPNLKSLVKDYLYLNSYTPYQNSYEEILFEGLFISYKYKSLEKKLDMLDNYIEKIDNWGICDSVISSVKVRESDKITLISFVRKELKSKSEYRLRFSILLMKKLVKDQSYLKELIANLKLIDKKNLDYYYVDMAIAWLLQELYITSPNEVIIFLEETNNIFIKRKTISKIIDSRTSSEESKECLRRWREENV